MLSGIRTDIVVLGAALVLSAGVRAQELPQGAGVQPGTAVTEQVVSQVRIVRVSQVRGTVRMDRNMGRGYEIAFTNIPVIAGAKLLTGEGVAEVEFEDNSSLRLAPDSEVEFARLGRSADGTTLTTVKVGKGVVYVSMQKDKHAGEFVLQYGSAHVVMGPGAHVRMDASQPQVEVAMFDGSARIDMGSATTMLARKQSISLNPAAETMASVQKGTEEARWDVWDTSQTKYHSNVAVFGLAGNNFGQFGANDLGYYGGFSDLPGCGSAWRPYFANAAWDPFGNGVWTYYQGAGYSWVSPYPWGWLPYHSGSWVNCGAAGWGWRPGGSWVGLANHGLLRVGGRPLPHPLPPLPMKGGATLVPVNTTPLNASGLTNDGKFTFRQNSAGLGVPRESFGKLNGFSTHAEQRGTATASTNALASSPAAIGLGGAGTAGIGRQSGAGSGATAGSGRSSAFASGARSGSMQASSGSSSAGGFHGGGGGSTASVGGGASGGGGGGGGHH